MICGLRARRGDRLPRSCRRGVGKARQRFGIDLYLPIATLSVDGRVTVAWGTGWGFSPAVRGGRWSARDAAADRSRHSADRRRDVGSTPCGGRERVGCVGAHPPRRDGRADGRGSPSRDRAARLARRSGDVASFASCKDAAAAFGGRVVDRHASDMAAVYPRGKQPASGSPAAPPSGAGSTRSAARARRALVRLVTKAEAALPRARLPHHFGAVPEATCGQVARCHGHRSR
jgi:hypothetical protein